MIPIVDLHQDFLSAWRLFDLDPWTGEDPWTRHGNLDRLRRTGYRLVVQAVFPLHRHWGTYLPEDPLAQALRTIERLRELVEQAKDRLRLITRREDLDGLLERDQLGILLGYEGMYGITDRWVLRALHRLGVRVLGLTWNVSNLVATGAWDDRDRGLSGLGRDLLLEADRLGFLLDLAHASPRTYEEVLALPLQRPPFVSHTGILPGKPQTRRNISLDLARRVVHRGGIVGLGLAKLFLEDPGATLDTVADRVRLLLREIPDGLASGSDFFGFGGRDTIEGLETVEGIRRLEQRLLEQGVAREALEAYLWRNAFRYLKANLP